MNSNHDSIPSLKDPMLLYLDDRSESHQAKELIESTGLTPFVTYDPVDPLQRKPLVLYSGGTYQGVDEIQGLLSLLTFWSQQGVQRGVFAPGWVTRPTFR